MENSLLTTLTALLLLGVREGITFSTSIPSPVTQMNPEISNDTTATPSSCPSPTPCQNTIRNITQPPVLARVKIQSKAESQCEGRLVLIHSEGQKSPLCFSSKIPSNWWNELCKDMRCGAFEGIKPVFKANGYLLNSNLTLHNDFCEGLHITCQDTLGSELAAYKAVTGILLFLILGVILLQFSRPMYKAIRKRFSQKRQNRWIGPTQSQSVSYHRGQAGGQPNNNTVKRQSYPGLEKLTVNPSREPSSNRNSDYDSYGYN